MKKVVLSKAQSIQEVSETKRKLLWTTPVIVLVTLPVHAMTSALPVPEPTTSVPPEISYCEEEGEIPICHFSAGQGKPEETICVDLQGAINGHFKKHPDDYPGPCITN